MKFICGLLPTRPQCYSVAAGSGQYPPPMWCVVVVVVCDVGGGGAVVTVVWRVVVVVVSGVLEQETSIKQNTESAQPSMIALFIA